jgi:hypothetical protein
MYLPKSRSFVPAGTDLAVKLFNTAVDDEEGPLSSVTSATLSDESKKAKRVRMTGSAAQSMRTARLHEKKKYNHAFKRATIVYAREKQKKVVCWQEV